MTAIVAVLNKHAVAVAADSAVTFGGSHKVVNSANKIFTLSKYEPVGIMTYNSADFMGVPWDIIIKLYRKELGIKNFPHLKDYVTDFIAFLKSKKFFISDEKALHLQIKRSIEAFYSFCMQYTFDNVPISPNSSHGILMFKNTMKNLSSFASKKEKCADFDVYDIQLFTTRFEKDFDDILDMPQLPVKLTLKEDKNLFKKCYFENLVAESDAVFFTGLVFVGYGTEEIYPSEIEMITSVAIDNRLKYFIKQEHHVSDIYPAFISPFAQKDVMQTIIGGINPKFLNIISRMLQESTDAYKNEFLKILQKHEIDIQVISEINNVVNRNIFNGLVEQVRNNFYNIYTQPLLKTLMGLDKEDMANLAESLISLTSLIRRMSPGEETVGGPVDVAVISKGDGFIWMKRKHYFDKEKNHHFFDNYYNE